jgi:putative PEP-CTERM system histidine kinase
MTPFVVSLQESALTASALLLATIGVLAALRRGHWLTTLLFSSAFLSMAAFQAGALGMLHADTPASAREWAAYMAGVSALTSWLWLALSVVMARPNPFQNLKDAAAYLTLALFACIALAVVAGTPYIVREVEGIAGDKVILLGAMGKIYLMYLVVVMVIVLMNLESMVRTAGATLQRRLRPLFFAFVVAILTDLMIVSGGLLFSGLRVTWLAEGAVPLFGAGVVAALTLARQRLSDMSVPVARPVVYYSSVSLTLAGLFLLTMAVLSKLLPVLTPEWKQMASVAFYLIVGGGGLLLTLSPRASRAVKRFIDRNFYANRYDYRREWERVTRALTPTDRPEEICRQIETLVRSLFEAGRITVHLREDSSRGFRRIYPAGDRAEAGALEADNSLVRHLDRLRAPIVFSEIGQDLDLIPIVVENRDTIQGMDAALCAPLHVGDELVGLLWLSRKKNDEEYSFEDVEFIGAMSRQLAAALWFARVADQLAETRQLESLNRLSTFVLHDIKNQVSGLSLVVENARRHMADPEFQRDAMKVVERTVSNLKALMAHVSGVGRPPLIQPGPCRVRDLLEDAVVASGLTPNQEPVRLTVRYEGNDVVEVDRGQVVRVLVNLLTNAREAVGSRGEIELIAALEGNGATPRLSLRVRDSGPGMSPEFVRDSLFRPFATTKPSGLGVGLMQCKGIVEAHGGRISVASRLGHGTTFEVRVPAGTPAGEAVESGVTAGEERS